MSGVSVQAAPIDLAAAMASLAVPGAGGVASFTGLVRSDDGVTTLELEHYPGATERALEELVAEARARWALLAVTVVHRVGPMVPGDVVVFVGTAAVHRAAALESCAFLIDRLKTDAPFWKRETRGDVARWVDARESDEIAAGQWRAAPNATQP